MRGRGGDGSAQELLGGRGYKAESPQNEKLRPRNSPLPVGKTYQNNFANTVNTMIKISDKETALNGEKSQR